MGRMANHAIVFARLIIPDEGGEVNDYGIAPFIVQIRDIDTHKHMPGIKSGDMGPKLGYASKDNGWLTFEHVKIPRDNLLQRFIKLDDEGSVSFGGDPRAIYTTMVKTRLTIIAGCRISMIGGLTVGLRYSAVRR